MRFLFVDRIVQSSRELIRGLKHVTCDDAYLSVDAQGRPCFIPSLVGEALGQLAAWQVMLEHSFTKRPVAGVVAEARLLRPAYVGETILLESFIDHLDDGVVEYHSVASVGFEDIFQLEGALGPLLPMEDFIDPSVVRRQHTQIDRPGDWHAIRQACTSTGLSPTMPLGQKSQMMVFDRVLACEPGISLSAEKRITSAAGYFADHFPCKPVLPMTVLLACKLNLANEFVALASFGERYQIKEMRKIKMNDFIHPGDIVICTVIVKRHEPDELVLHFRSTVADKRVCVVDIMMKPQGCLDE